MDTLRRPELRPGRIDRLDLLGYGLLSIGYGLMVLGIYEIGGLASLGVGFLVIWIGAIIILARERTRQWPRGPLDL